MTAASTCCAPYFVQVYSYFVPYSLHSTAASTCRRLASYLHFMLYFTSYTLHFARREHLPQPRKLSLMKYKV